MAPDAVIVPDSVKLLVRNVPAAPVQVPPVRNISAVPFVEAPHAKPPFNVNVSFVVLFIVWVEFEQVNVPLTTKLPTRVFVVFPPLNNKLFGHVLPPDVIVEVVEMVTAPVPAIV